jgi:hypothetical protein
LKEIAMKFGFELEDFGDSPALERMRELQRSQP